MQQTIQFDPERDPVSTVLLQVARAYGFTGITEAMAANGKMPSIYPKRLPPREPEIVWQPLHEVAWTSSGDSEAEAPVSPQVPAEPFELALNGSPWSVKTVTEFLHRLTVSAQKGMALLAVKGTVSAEEMCAYLGVESMQGVFSTIGSAVKAVEGLPDEARPYWRHRSPTKLYRMDPGMQRLFNDAFLGSRRVKNYLEQAKQYIEVTTGRRG
jgi:hypothetical protein